jgi:hypothetical protein
LPPLPPLSTSNAQKEGKNNEKFSDLKRILLPKILPVKIPGGGGDTNYCGTSAVAKTVLEPAQPSV